MISDVEIGQELNSLQSGNEQLRGESFYREVLNELLALRKAFSEPFCFTDNAGIDLWHMDESFEVWPERTRETSIPLYRKP